MTARSWPLFTVDNVPASSEWYQELLACVSDMEQGHPHRQEYDRIVDSSGEILVSFHSREAEETPVDRLLGGSDPSARGQGVLVTFALNDLDGAIQRASKLGAEFLSKVADYPDGSRAILLRDREGYTFQLSSGRQR